MREEVHAMDEAMGERRIVYTALMGKYETLVEQPEASTSGVEFVCFTDDPDLHSDSWRVVLVQPRFPQDSIRSARYIKIIGDDLVRNYGQSIWIDNRVVLKPGFTELFDNLQYHDIAVPGHSFRTSVKSEGIAVIESGYDDPSRVREELIVLSDLGLDTARPFWTGILLRRNTDAVTLAMQIWYEHVLRYSRRDQLSANIAFAGAPVSVLRLEIENAVSKYHSWLPTAGLERRKRVQRWVSTDGRRHFLRSIGDLARTSRPGRIVLKALTYLGIRFPAL
jgi:Protein of unknown function (DUF616)